MKPRSHAWVGGVILATVALTQRPFIDLSRGDFPLYLQAKSFAELRLDIPVPASAGRLSADMATKDGRVYSHYPPGASLLLVPFYELGHWLDLLAGGRLGESRAEGWSAPRGGFFAVHAANLAYFTILLALIVRVGAVLGLDARAVRHALLLSAFAAPLVSYSSHLSTQLPSTVAVVAALVLAFECRPVATPKLAAAGLAAAVALLVRPMNVLVVGLVGLYVLATFRHPFRAALAFGLPAALGVALNLWFNAAMFGSPFESGYLYGVAYGRHGAARAVLTDNRSAFGFPIAEGLLGLTIGAVSPDPPRPGRVLEAALPTAAEPWHRVRGLLLLMPALVFAVPGFRAFAERGKRAEAAVLCFALILPVIVYSKWLFWFASVHAPLANRYFCEAYPLWCIGVAAYGARATGAARTGLWFAVYWSVGVQLFSLAAVYLNFFVHVDPTTWPTAVVLLLVAGFGAALAWRTTAATGVAPSARAVASVGRW